MCYFIWFIDSFLNFVLYIIFKYFRKGEVWNIYKIKMVRKIMWYLLIEIYFLNMYYVICWVCFEIFIDFYLCNLVYVLFFRFKNDLLVSVFDLFLMDVIVIVIVLFINIFFFCCF